MRKAITVSLSDDIHRYVLEQGQYGTVSEYIRTLIRHDPRRRLLRAMKNYSKPPRRANDCLVDRHALHLLDRLRMLLESVETDED